MTPSNDIQKRELMKDLNCNVKLKIKGIYFDSIVILFSYFRDYVSLL